MAFTDACYYVVQAIPQKLSDEPRLPYKPTKPYLKNKIK